MSQVTRTAQSKKPSYFREPKLSDNSQFALLTRSAVKDDKDNFLESCGEIFYRVANHVAKAEVYWEDEKAVEFYKKQFFEGMVSLDFICASSILVEAGNPTASNQLSSCFVVPVEDNIQSIFDNLGKAAIIQKNHGGTGFNFSKIRPCKDKVRGVFGMASGPIDFLQVYSAALSKIYQGGTRHGGNICILNVDHPDILEFIQLKDTDGNIKNFNLSVGITNAFMEAVEKDKSWSLINPRDGSTMKTLPAKEIFNQICEHAWVSGDPGILFLDRTEEDNFTPTVGRLNATNPCGEQPLLPFENCNLCSINLANHVTKVKDGYEIDWEKLGKTASTVVRFLDDMIEVNTYVLPETEKIVRHGNRKIGAGVMGFGHMLYKLGISYASADAIRMAKKLSKFLKQEFERTSMELAKTRGVFPNFDVSTYRGTSEKFRNCTMFTIAPTGTISMIANTSSGIEPTFSLAYERRTFFNKNRENTPGDVLTFLDPVLEQTLKERGLFKKSLIQKIIDNNGSLKGLSEIPMELQQVFITTHDIPWEYHVKIQAAWQTYVDNSVSKTINMPFEATVDDIKKAYLLAWKLGCKGVTVYRDGSRAFQVMATTKTKKLGK